MRVEVRAVEAGDETAWRELWQAYCRFYEQEIPERVTAATWRRVLDPDVAMGGLVAVDGEAVVGFVNYLPHPSTWAEEESGYLEDLFVSPEARGAGAGRALIEAVLAIGRELGWRRVYWHTAAGNARARALYDSFTEADGFVRYVVEPL